MISIKSKAEIEIMQKAGRAAARALKEAGEAVRPGITTKELDKIIFDVLKREHAKPSFLNYNGFPASSCISINEEVIHGIPSSKVIKNGDLVKIDVGACIEGYHGDTAKTFIAGETTEQKIKLVKACEQSFYEGIKKAKNGFRIGDISSNIQTYVEANNYFVVKSFTGHGIGSKLHEDPEVPNYGAPGTKAKLSPGMTIAIEPMINVGTEGVSVLKDGWTVITNDLSLSAHYEHTVLITDGEPIILTLP